VSEAEEIGRIESARRACAAKCLNPGTSAFATCPGSLDIDLFGYGEGKGKLIGQKPPLRPKHVWSIRTRLQMDGRSRDLAMFNLAIESNLRAVMCAERVCGRSRDGAAEEDRSTGQIRIDGADAPNRRRLHQGRRKETRRIAL
jgi:hypothetical protein